MWFLIALMLGTSPTGQVDTFVWYKPQFETVDECLEFARSPVGVVAIRERLGQEFPGRDLQNLYCIPEDKLKEFIQTTLDDNKIQA
jgi:hypothetical protein